MTQDITTIPVIEIAAELPRGRAGYDAIIAASTATLAPDEFWVISHDKGPLWDTAAKTLDTPIRIFCDALDCDWGDATEAGFRLARMRRPSP